MKTQQIVYLISTEWGKWGKGATLPEAFRNAQFCHSHRFSLIIIYTDNPEECYMDNLGGVHCPKGSQINYEKDDQGYLKVYDRFELIKSTPEGILLDYLLDEYLKDDPKSRQKIEAILYDAKVTDETHSQFDRW